ncbi:sulfatase family protein [Prosthecobacter vanneervenii]|uniref:Arylsulfatase A-like enzyme n=1 Tax=Prosthecobacter vanneervenii TaxID=48466 RepID=A0A7W7YAH5_9BACT|nr:arylsulfatase [Prosthecobacter vanneervenii]MBB5032621.1 arylsulfatase A-like enzyme [Prosthecobacter vanneervenii]
MRLLLAFALLLSAASSFAADTPNIVIILADDYGYGSAGCYGADGSLVQTPNIDRLAREGRRFTDANTTSSVCSPTRYSVMTGRYCWRTSLTHEVLGTFSPLHIETTRLNMASLLKKHGYQTAAIGKWHLGYGTDDGSLKWRTDYTAELSPGPLDIGFDYHFGVPSNHGDLTGVFVENRFVYGLRSGKIPAGMKLKGPDSDDPNFKATYGPEDTENGKVTILDLDAPRRVNQRVMPLLTTKAAEWITQQKKGTPFFLYYTPVAVHNPVTPDKDMAGKSKAGPYGDWIQELDRSVGGVLKALDEKGVAQDTLVILSSDNGGVFTPTRDSVQTQAYKAGLKVNASLRGGKHDVWEGGFKVPFITRWPAKIPAGTVCDDMISLADILATTAAIVGEPLPAAATAAEDSFNALPAFLGTKGAAPTRDHMFIHSADGVFAIRKGPWKWIEGVPVSEIKLGARKSRASQFKAQLYNMKEDPAETVDVSAQHPEVVKELSALVNRYRDGGYSREMPPIVEKKPPPALPALQGKEVLAQDFKALPAKPWTLTRGTWQVHDEAIWNPMPKTEEQGATLTGPLPITDGTLQYEMKLHSAGRVSLRIHTAGKHSFRIVVSSTQIEITKNPDPGQDKTQTEPLARQKLKLNAEEWQTVRVSFKGDEVTAQVAGVTAKGRHAVIAEAKEQQNLIVFDGEAGFKNLRVVQ